METKKTSLSPKEPRRIKVILDTNFLLIPAYFKVDIFRELDKVLGYKHDIVILQQTLDELENIKTRQRGRNKEAAKLAIGLIKAKNINILSTAIKHADDAILKMAKKDCFVATQDKNLKKRLKTAGLKVITLRQKKYLTVV